MYRFFQIPVTAGADIKGCQGIDPAGKADQKTGKKGDKDTGRSYGTKGKRACKFTDNRNIRHIEKHLKDIGKHQGNAEYGDFFKQRTFTKVHFILFHNTSQLS